MSDITQHATDFAGNLGEAVRKNPVSAALIGMGLVWLFANRMGVANPVERIGGVAGAAQDVWRGAASNLKERSQDVSDNVTSAIRDQGANLVQKVSRTGGDLAGTVSDFAGALPDRAGDLLGDMRSNMGEVFRAQPLALGAVGLAIGAAIAAALPVTDAEREYLGETSDLVKDTLGEVATEKAHAAADLGERVLSAVTKEAQAQGLTQEGMKSAAGQVSDKVSRVLSPASRPASQ